MALGKTLCALAPLTGKKDHKAVYTFKLSRTKQLSQMSSTYDGAWPTVVMPHNMVLLMMVLTMVCRSYSSFKYKIIEEIT